MKEIIFFVCVSIRLVKSVPYIPISFPLGYLDTLYIGAAAQAISFFFQGFESQL